MDITALEYSTFRAAGGAAQAVALQFNVDYDLTDADTSWQGRLVYEPYYTQTVETGKWQTWDTLTTGANWWSTGTPKVGDAVATKHCLISDPCTWEEVLSYYPDAGIHELPLGAVTLKAGSAWAGFEGNADELKIATGTTGTIFDFDPFAGLPCVVDWAGGGNFTTIADALAQPYCTEIEVAAGTYNEQVVIDRSLTLSGDPGDAAAGPGPNAPILDGNDVSGSAITIAGGVSGVVIEGFEFRNYAPGASGGIGVGVLAWNATPINDVIVRDNHFSNLGWSAVLVGNEGQASHSGWTVARNTAEDVGVYVIELTNTANSSVTDNVVIGGTAYGKTTDDAILIQAQVHVGAGITVNSVAVDGNQISGTVERAGIELLAWDSSNSLTAALAGITVSNNEVSDAERGVFLYPAGSNGSVAATVAGNTLSNNAVGVRASSWSGGTFGVVTINRNAITDNTAGFSNPTAQPLDATCNWWGDHWGPSGAGPGAGDSVTADVGFLPWLITDDLAGECGGGIDTDRDGVFDIVDNCPFVKNRNQADRDGDGVGDVCDPDIDGDGVPNHLDAYPYNPNRWDLDSDGDGIPDAVDNCPFVKNRNQADRDGDGVGDRCDPDIDGDGVLNENDAYPYNPNKWEKDVWLSGDSDRDGVPDDVDNCPFVKNSDQRDRDGDGVGDVCDPDIDGDGVLNENDAYPYNPNRWELDSDWDGVPDAVDNCPFVKNGNQLDLDGDGVGNVCDPDIDGDGVLNENDAYPYNPNRW
jgi:hypothetical protein